MTYSQLIMLCMLGGAAPCTTLAKYVWLQQWWQPQGLTPSQVSTPNPHGTVGRERPSIKSLAAQHLGIQPHIPRPGLKAALTLLAQILLQELGVAWAVLGSNVLAQLCGCL